LQGNWILEKLPFRLQRIELVDELTWVSQKVVIVIFVSVSKPEAMQWQYVDTVSTIYKYDVNLRGVGPCIFLMK